MGGREGENVNENVCTMEKNKQVNKTKQQKTTGKNITDQMNQFNFQFLGKTIQDKLTSSTWKIWKITSSQKRFVKPHC